MEVVARNIYYKLITTYEQGAPHTVEVREVGIQGVPNTRSLEQLAKSQHDLYVAIYSDDRIIVTTSISFTGDGMEYSTKIDMRGEDA